MRIEIKRIVSWSEALNSARFTQRKDLKSGNPSKKFIKKLIKAEHSPLRCIMFTIDLYDIPYYVSVHFTRHIHAQPFVSTSRPDIDGNQLPRSEQKKSDLVNMRLFLNAQEIIHISKVRLCNRAELETKRIWNAVISKLADTEPELAAACVPTCVYRGFCPEFKTCGFANTDNFIRIRENYIKYLV